MPTEELRFRSLCATSANKYRVNCPGARFRVEIARDYFGEMSRARRSAFAVAGNPTTRVRFRESNVTVPFETVPRTVTRWSPSGNERK